MISTKWVRALALIGLVFLFAGCKEGHEAEAGSNLLETERKIRDSVNASRLKKLTEGLELTTEQQAQVKALFAAEAADVEKIHAEAERTEGNQALALNARRKKTYEEIKTLLTPDQAAKYDKVLKNLTRKR